MRFLLLLVAASSMLNASPAVATTKNPAMKDVVEYEPLQDSHLIVRGTIASVRQESISISEWFSSKPSNGTNTRIPMETIEVVVAEVLKGQLGETRVTFMVADGWPFSPGEHVIICARLVRGKTDTAFFASEYNGMFVSEGKTWRRCTTSKEQAKDVLTLSDIRFKIQQVSLINIVDASDVIARGIITRVSESSYKAADGRTGKFKHYALRVSEILKGQFANKEIEFVVPRIDASYVPNWYRRVPRAIDTGQEWIVFLRESELGFYLFGGPNSALMVKGNNLIYDMAVTYPHNVEKATSLIRSEVSGDGR